jgi:arylsulfatase A-like enzyme
MLVALLAACAVPALESPAASSAEVVGAVGEPVDVALPTADSAVPPPQPDGPRNVLVVLLDDVGADQLSVFDGDDEPVHTPHLAGLADQGLVYPFAYAYPSCSPTRAALVTGQHAWRNGVATPVDQGDPSLRDDIETFPEYLDRIGSGVSTAWVGKWHLVPPGPGAQHHPNDRGFHRFEGTLGNLYTTHERGDDPVSWHQYAWISDGTIERVEGIYATTKLVDEAVDVVTTLPEPWFVVVAPHAAHHPFRDPPAELLPEGVEPSTDARGAYRRMILGFDTELGRLLQAVDLSDTVVIYMGDNGVPSDVASDAIDPREAKGTVYEGGWRVGMVAAGAGVPAAGVSSQLVSVVDIVPTAADLLGVPPPERTHGVSWVPLWDTADVHTQQHEVVLAFEGPRHDRIDRVARSVDFKLWRHPNGEDRLYDLRGGAVRDGDDLLAAGPLSPEEEAAYEALRVALPPPTLRE